MPKGRATQHFNKFIYFAHNTTAQIPTQSSKSAVLNLEVKTLIVTSLRRDQIQVNETLISHNTHEV